MTDEAIFNLILISTLIMLILAVSVLIVFLISQKRIMFEKSIQQKQELEYKNKLINSVITTQEQERERIARELHDELGSRLNIVSLNLNILSSHQEFDSTEIKHKFEEISDSLDYCLERSRDISHELLPPILVKFGLQSALSSLCTNVNRTGKVKVELKFECEWVLNKQEELHLYRIIQELINNSLKHANASIIQIFSKIEDGKLVVEYFDDGVGTNNLVTNSGLGIHNIVSRANLLNATIDWTNNKQKGFYLKFIK